MGAMYPWEPNSRKQGGYLHHITKLEGPLNTLHIDHLDKGTVFAAQEFKTFCEEQAIEHVTITKGVPRGNAQFESIYRRVVPALAKLSLESSGNWYKFVGSSLKNFEFYVSTKCRQHSIRSSFRVKMRNKEDLRVKEIIDAKVTKQFQLQREGLRETLIEATRGKSQN
ncbi:hypothetical protein ILUMI_14504, partial [Ignelater luminosus]